MDRVLTEVIRRPSGGRASSCDAPLAPPPNAGKLLQRAEAWIHRYPGVSLGIAVMVGVCIGWLVKRK